MSRTNLIETASAILESNILTKSDGSRTKGARSMSRHLTFVKNNTGDTKYHRAKLEKVIVNTVAFHGLVVK
jgi:hypothetical protein